MAWNICVEWFCVMWEIWWLVFHSFARCLTMLDATNSATEHLGFASFYLSLFLFLFRFEMRFSVESRLVYDYNLTNHKIHKFNIVNLWS